MSVNWRIFDYNGQIAITLGWWPDQDTPTESRPVVIGAMKAADWPDLIGRTVEFTGNAGIVYNGHRRQIINTDDKANWQHITESRPVPKPRRGKRQGMRYDWEWERGKWHRVWVG